MRFLLSIYHKNASESLMNSGCGPWIHGREGLVVPYVLNPVRLCGFPIRVSVRVEGSELWITCVISNIGENDIISYVSIQT